jgi:putative hemolysin
MRSTLIIISTLIALSSCTMPWSTPAAPANIEYSTTQSGSPAAVYCGAHGGQISYEKNPQIPTMDLIYCTVGGEKMDAWKYMDVQTMQTGAIVGSGSMPL